MQLTLRAAANTTTSPEVGDLQALEKFTVRMVKYEPDLLTVVHRDRQRRREAAELAQVRDADWLKAADWRVPG